MLVTFAVFHLERSALNADALSNDVEVNAMVDPIQNKSRRRTKKWRRGRKQNSKRKKQGTEEQRSAVDLLCCMVVTFAVFHLERSELNADAPSNAVEVKAMVDPVQKQVKKETEEMGKGKKTEFEKEETMHGRTKKWSELTG